MTEPTSRRETAKPEALVTMRAPSVDLLESEMLREAAGDGMLEAPALPSDLNGQEIGRGPDSTVVEIGEADASDLDDEEFADLLGGIDAIAMSTRGTELQAPTADEAAPTASASDFPEAPPMPLDQVVGMQMGGVAETRIGSEIFNAAPDAKSFRPPPPLPKSSGSMVAIRDMFQLEDALGIDFKLKRDPTDAEARSSYQLLVRHEWPTGDCEPEHTICYMLWVLKPELEERSFDNWTFGMMKKELLDTLTKLGTPGALKAVAALKDSKPPRKR